MHQIKIKRALKKSKIGTCPGSAHAMLAYIPQSIMDQATSSAVAEMLDALWLACGTSKAIAEREAIQNGFVWDAPNNRARDIAA